MRRLEFLCLTGVREYTRGYSGGIWDIMKKKMEKVLYWVISGLGSNRIYGLSYMPL